MQLYGLIGKHLKHSFSAQWFADLFEKQGIDARYRLFELETPELIPALLEEHPDLKGLNVTLPYKREVLEYCSRLSPEVLSTGAANCLKIEKNEISAYNTDTDGFSEAFEHLPGDEKNTGAMILGTGGGAAAAAFVLRSKGVPVMFVSRSPYQNPGSVAYEDLKKSHFECYPLIVNATPIGMWPNIAEAPPLPYAMLQGKELLYDMVYNPLETMFMRKGRERGCFAENGIEMLHRQAMRSWEIWNNR